MIIEMKGLSQVDIPTGCESVSMVMVLNYLGVQITAEEFIDLYLPKKQFYRVDGRLYGPDPREVFAGNPYSKNSLGCFPKVILKALEHMQSDAYPGTGKLCGQDISGSSLQQMIERYIRNMIPVLLWCTMEMRESRPGMQYYLKDDRLYTWRAGEHCMVLCGYDQMHYYLLDPRKEGEMVIYEKALVEARYTEMGRHAAVVYSSG